MTKNKKVSSCRDVAFRVFSHNTNLIKFRHLSTTQMLCKLQYIDNSLEMNENRQKYLRKTVSQVMETNIIIEL